MTCGDTLKGIGYWSVMMLLTCPVAEADHGMEVKGPKIMRLKSRLTGSGYNITCAVMPGLLEEETLVYWLVNNTFVDMAYPDGRVEIEETKSGDLIQTQLVIKNISPEDLFSSFTCTALNPAGSDQKSMKIVLPRPDKRKKPRRKRKIPAKHTNNTKALMTNGIC